MDFKRTMDFTITMDTALLTTTVQYVTNPTMTPSY